MYTALSSVYICGISLFFRLAENKEKERQQPF